MLFAIALIVCLFAAACGTLTGLLRSTETALPRPTRTPTSPVEGAVQTQGVYWQSVLIDSYGVTTGASASIYLYMWPSVFVQDGKEWQMSSTSAAIQVAEMRFCWAVADTCSPRDDWLPFENSYEIKIPVDWEGDRLVTIAVEFRLASGESVLSQYETETSLLPFSSTTFTITGLRATETPDISATLLAYPVTGQIVPDRSIIGGTAGSKASLLVRFSAQSPYGKVTEMRMGGWLELETSEIDAPWEPFAAEKTFEVSVPLNWSTFYLAVQFRDEKGNLSQIYRMEVAVEGSPAMPTP